MATSRESGLNPPPFFVSPAEHPEEQASRRMIWRPGSQPSPHQNPTSAPGKLTQRHNSTGQAEKENEEGSLHLLLEAAGWRPKLASEDLNKENKLPNAPLLLPPRQCPPHQNSDSQRYLSKGQINTVVQSFKEATNTGSPHT